MKIDKNMSLDDKVNQIIDKDLFNKYKKFLAIQNINSSTLVPFAFLLGNQGFKYYIIDDIRDNKSIVDYGNIKVPNKIKFLNDKLLNTYLKIIDLKKTDLKMNTLLPLGLLIMIYDVYIN